jgi:phenylalanyl-tRNA synthetase beta chain
MTRTGDDGVSVDIANQQVYKIEVAANRYDLLCLEGIAAAFRCYLGKQDRLPRYQIREVSYPL